MDPTREQRLEQFNSEIFGHVEGWLGDRISQIVSVFGTILDTHGVLHARPRPRYGTFAPVFTPNGIAAFGRDFDSSRQVWSKHEGYPGDVRYRDFFPILIELVYSLPFEPVIFASLPISEFHFNILINLLRKIFEHFFLFPPHSVRLTAAPLQARLWTRRAP